MKRIFDLIAIIVFAPLYLPLAIVASIIVWCTLGRPILFSQIRPGLNGELFKMYKFRTMRDAKDINGKALPDSERLTKAGRILRSTSLDELPGLWSVFKGNMALVGPRPLLKDYLPLYTEEQARRHNVRPGITGWAQVNGRNAISWEEKFELDVWYVDNRSFLLDLKILFLTVVKVFNREGVTHGQSDTMPRFTGSKP